MRTRCLNRLFGCKENQLNATVPVESVILDIEQDKCLILLTHYTLEMAQIIRLIDLIILNNS